MSIELLEQVAAQRLPHDFADLYLCDGLWVLRTAGLIAAFSVRVPGAQGEPGPRIARATGSRRVIAVDQATLGCEPSSFTSPCR